MRTDQPLETPVEGGVVLLRRNRRVELVAEPLEQRHLGSIARSSAVIDLTLEQLALPSTADPRWIPTEVFSEHAHDRALAAYHRWQVAVSTMPLSDGRTPADALTIADGLSGWWLLPSMIRHFNLGGLPRLLLKALWLLDADDDHPAIRAVREADRVRVWCESGPAARVLSEAVRLRGGRPGGHRRTGRRSAEPTPWRNLARAGVAGGRALAWACRPRPRGTVRGCPRFAVVTRSGDWERQAEGRWINRYLADAPERWSSAGVRHAWIPLAYTRSDLRLLREALAGCPVPWDTLHPGPRRVLGVLRRGASLALRARRVAREIEGAARAECEGLDLGAWVAAELRSVAVERGVRAGLLRLQHEGAVAGLEPRVVLTKDEFFPFGQAVCSVRRSGTQTWAYQHGTIPLNHWLYRNPAELVAHAGRPERWTAGSLPTPDLLLTYGEHEVGLLRATGHPEDALAAIGSLRHDRLFELAARVTPEDRRRTRERLALPADVTVILLCTQWESTIVRWLRLVAEGCRSAAPSAHVRIRPHWNTRWREAVAEGIEAAGLTSWSVDEGSLSDSLLACDVLISATSTTIVEGAVLGRPSICICREGAMERRDYAESGLSIAAFDGAEMAQALTTTLSPSYLETWESIRRREVAARFRNVREPATSALVRLLAKRGGVGGAAIHDGVDDGPLSARRPRPSS